MPLVLNLTMVTGISQQVFFSPVKRNVVATRYTTKFAFCGPKFPTRSLHTFLLYGRNSHRCKVLMALYTQMTTLLFQKELETHPFLLFYLPSISYFITIGFFKLQTYKHDNVKDKSFIKHFKAQP